MCVRDNIVEVSIIFITVLQQKGKLLVTSEQNDFTSAYFHERNDVY